MSETGSSIIRTPDQRLRVFVSSTLQEVADERKAARQAIEQLRLAPVMFELGARPHPPKDLYRAYLDQSDIFLGIYWQRYGWVAPDMEISGLEDEWRLSGDRPKLIYIKAPAPDRDTRLKELLDKVRNDDRVSYKPFTTPDELRDLIENDLALLLTERFAISRAEAAAPAPVTETVHHNLPLQLTHFIGRERELADLKQAILAHRLVTLLGPGGAGKTRLSLQAASELLDVFADGVWFIELAPINDAALIVQTVAETLSIREEPGRPLMTTLFERLRGQHALLILDNCEHLIEACAQFANALLRACANVRLIVSSREALGIAGELSFRVPPLAVPDPRQLPALDALKQYDAIKLFADRAMMALPGFSITESNAAAIAQICHRLDGIPLAIELAAARVKMLKAEQIAARLDDRFKLLTSGSRTALPRQQTLRAAIDWSYDLLNTTERTVMRRLAVCVGGWTLEAAEAIATGEDVDADNVFDLLDSLLNKSMIVVDYDQDQTARYRFLETMRDYALEKLRLANELEASQHRLFDFYLALTETAEPHLWHSAERAAWLNRLEMEHDNLRAALNIAQSNDQLELLARLTAALGQFWNERALFREGRQWLDTALAQRERLSKPVLAQTLRAAARLAGRQGDFDLAEDYAQDSVTLWRELNDKAKLAQALNTLAAVASERGEVERSATYNAEVLALYRVLNDRRGVAQALSDVGWAAVFQSDYARGIPLLEESLTLERQLEDTLGVAWATLALGTARLLNGEIEAAAALLHESLILYRPTNNKWYIAGCLEGLASVASAQHQPERAAQLLGAHDRLVEEMGAKIPVFWERAIRQPLLAQLNAVMDEATYQAEWANGHALTPEQVFELALSQRSQAQ